MTRLYINKKAVVLPRDLSLKIVLKNPVTSEQGSWSFPVTLPDDDDGINASIFNHANRVTRANLDYDNFVFLLIIGVWQLSGTVEYVETSEGFKINLKPDATSIYSIYEGLKLHEMDYTGVWPTDIGHTPTIQEQLDFINARKDFIDGGDFAFFPWRHEGADTPRDYGKGWNFLTNAFESYNSGTATCINDCSVYLLWALKNLFWKNFGFTLRDVYMGNLTELKKLVIFLYNVDGNVNSANWIYALPDIEFKEFLENIGNRFNLHFVFDYNRGVFDIVQGEVIFSRPVHNITERYISHISLKNNFKEGFEFSVDQKSGGEEPTDYWELTSEINLNEISQILQVTSAQMQNIYGWWDQKTLVASDKLFYVTDLGVYLRPRSRNERLWFEDTGVYYASAPGTEKDIVADWDELYDKYGIRPPENAEEGSATHTGAGFYIYMSSTGYMVYPKAVSGSYHLPAGIFNPVTVGDGETKYDSKISVLRERSLLNSTEVETDVYEYYNYFIPAFDGKGQTYKDMLLGSRITGDDGLFIMLFHGLLTVFSDQFHAEKIPFAYYRTHDVTGKEIVSGNISLTNKDIAEKLYKKTFEWHQRRQRKRAKLYVDDVFLSGLKWIDKYRLKDQNYFIDEIEVTITNEGITPECQADLYTE